MCGIFGAINFNGFFDKSDYGKFVSLTDLVRYRGPDAAGYEVFNTKGTGTNNDAFDIFLGHRRLSILDLSQAGNQPFTDENGLWIVYNGEIFNYIELRNELVQKGHTFKSNTDTEVILHVYKEYGETGFDKLNGMWAFAILDIPKRKLILSRDRFSIKPLYFISVNDKIYFASEIKQLLPLLEKKELNAHIMFSYLSQGLLDHNDQTFYQGIHKIKPKTNVVIQCETGKIEEKQYWDYHPEEQLSWADAVERFRELFIDSVKIRLRSDVKIGALLSGGLDSSAIAVVAHDLQHGNFETYSVVSEDKRYSEEKFINVLSKGKGIQNDKLYYKQNESLDAVEETLFHNDEPFGGFSIVAQYKIFEKIKKETDIVVVLSGQGGDETLMGYLKYFFFYLQELLKNGRVMRSFQQIFLSFMYGTVLTQFKYSDAKRYMPFLTKRSPPSFLNLENHYEPIWEVQSTMQRQRADVDKYSVPALTHYEDRNSMAHSLEVRLPFLDHRLVNFVLNLPAEMKIHKGWTKYILREAFYELPKEIRWRRDKQGFITPEEKWLKDDFKERISKVFTTKSALEELGMINAERFLKYYEKFISGDRTIAYMEISRVFIAELWGRKFLQ